MTNRPLLVLSLEGLAPAALGCYGSSWNPTPAIDAIASTGSVWDRCIADFDDPVSLLQKVMAEPSSEWAARWREQGSLELLTDSSELVHAMRGSCFDRVESVEIEPPTVGQPPETELVDTQLGRLIAAGIDRGTQDDSWSVLWIHSVFLTQCWDAPRKLFAIDDEDDATGEPSEEVELLTAGDAPAPALEPVPPIYDDVIPPRIELDDQTHPDLVTSWMRTYGCQVALLDLLAQLLIESLADRNPRLMLLGASGFRLGQGGWLGYRPATVRSADLRLPVLVGDGGPLRIPHLTSAAELLPQILRDLADPAATLISEDRWSQAAETARIESQSDRGDVVVSTSGWFFVRDADNSEHLFLKPDDVEDFNDISRLRHDIVKELSPAEK